MNIFVLLINYNGNNNLLWISMNLDHFCRNGVIITIPAKDLKQLQEHCTYHEKETAFSKKTHLKKPRVVCLAEVKHTTETTATVKLPKYLTPYKYKQTKYQINIHDSIQLHDSQKKYFDVMKQTLKEKQGMCLNLAAGTGKTVLAIKLISLLKLKTIIIVHKEFLRDQWIDSIVKFTNLPRESIGIIQGQQTETDKPITIAMLQSLWKKQQLDIHYNLLIVDEVHNIGAEAFFKSLTTVLPICKYTLGLSGTTDRVDGLSPLFEAYLGKIVKPQAAKQKTTLKVCIHYLDSESDAYMPKVNSRTRMLDVVGITTSLAKYQPRTEYIFKILQQYIGQQVIVLSERVCFLDTLAELLDNAGISYTCNYGKHRTYKQTNNGIILATFAMASEAFDVQDLNVLLLASSISTPNKFLQSVGRINRNNCVQQNIPKIIVDFVDKPLQHQHNKRMKLLRDNFSVTSQSITKEL